MAVEKCYVIYDCPSLENDKQWLTDGLTRNGIKVEEIVPGKVQSTLGRKGIRGIMELYLSIIGECLRALRISTKNDVIICWFSLCGVILNTLAILMRKQRTIISMNWMSPGKRKSHIYALQKKLFTNPNVYITVNSKLSAEKWCDYFSIPFCRKNKFIFLPDVFDDSEPFVEPHDNRNTGGGVYIYRRYGQQRLEDNCGVGLCIASDQICMRGIGK